MSKLGGKKKTVYHFVRELIVEGKYAWFVNREGRYRIKWDDAVERYIEYRAKKNPSYDLNIDRKKASNSFREGLLRRYRDDADGPKEYEDCQEVGENKKIVVREFQMPSELFHLLFGTSKVQRPGDQVDEKLQVCPDSGISDASDTGFEEAMDVSDAPQGNNKREDPFDPTNIATSDEIFHFSDEELLQSVLEDISTHSDSDVNQPKVLQDISPSSGSVKGGIQFHIMLKEALLEGDTTGVANFNGIGDVFLVKTNPYTFSGFVPAAQEAGRVLITVYTEAGQKLGVTCFTYVDEMYEALKQLLKDPAQLSKFLTMCSQAHEIIGSNSNVAQTLGLFSLSDQGSLPDAKQVQSLKVLQLLVYTAAEVGAQQFLEVIFSTSAGKIVFDSYKDCIPLPKDVARANGHGELAEFLQDVDKRLSKESDGNSHTLGVSDWLELVQAVDNMQKQTVSNDEQESSRMQPNDDDDQSDYFADAETSSCGSLELIGDWSDLEEENGACTKDEDCENATIETGIDNCASLLRYPQEEHLRISLGFSEENEATEESFEDETQLGNGKDNIESPSICEESSVVNFPAKIKLRQRRERRDDSDSEHKYATESLHQEKTTELYTSREEFPKNSSRFSEENAATEESFEDEAVFGNCQDDIESSGICEESSVVNFPAYKRLPLLRSFFQWLSRREDDLSAEQQDVCSLQAERMGSVSQNKGTKRRDDGGSRQKYAAESSRQEKTTKSKKHRQRGHWIKFETASRVRYILLTAALVTVLAGIKLADKARDENISYADAECDLDYPVRCKIYITFIYEDIRPCTVLRTQCYSAWKRLIPGVGTSPKPNLSIGCLVNHQLKDIGDSDSKVIKQFSAENEDIQPFTNSSQEERACKGNGCKVWTLACKTENATGERQAIYIRTNKVKHSLISIVIGVTFIVTIILLLKEQSCFKNYFAKFLFHSPEPRRNNYQKEPSNTESGWSAYIPAFKTENTGGERQTTYHGTNRVKHLLVTIHCATVTHASFIVTCIYHLFAKMFPKFTGPKPSSATFIIRPTSKPPTSTNSSNDVNWLRRKNDPLDGHKQSKRRNQQTTPERKGKPKKHKI